MKKHKNKGYTLVETLVSLLVLGVIISFVFQGLNMGIKALNKAELLFSASCSLDKTIGLLKIGAVKAEGQSFNDGENSIEISESGEAWPPDDERFSDINQIKIFKVTVKSENKEYAYPFETVTCVE